VIFDYKTIEFMVCKHKDGEGEKCWEVPAWKRSLSSKKSCVGRETDFPLVESV